MDVDFGEMYETYYPKIFNYVYYRLLNRESAEDVVSEVFLKAMGNVHGFDGERASMATWLFRIAANAVNDYFRGRKKVAFVPLEDADPPIPDRTCDEVTRAEDLRRLRECLQALDDRERSVVGLRYWGEFSYTEIAAQTGLTEKNVGVILSRTVTRLKKTFETL